MSAATKKKPFAALSAYPTIQHLNGHHFFHDDYTGELISHRVGLPGVLVRGRKCPPEMRDVIFGAFKNVNVLLTYINEYGPDIGTECQNACISWLNDFAGTIIIPAPPRSSLSLFGGGASFDQYHKLYPQAPSRSITAQQDNTHREEMEAKKKAEPKIALDATAHEEDPKKFNIHKYIRSETAKSRPGYARFTVTCFPALNYWDIDRVPIDMGCHVPSNIERDLGVQFEDSTTVPSHLHLEISSKELTKSQLALVKKQQPAPVVDLAHPKKKRVRVEGEKTKKKPKKKDPVTESAKSDQCPSAMPMDCA